MGWVAGSREGEGRKEREGEGGRRRTEGIEGGGDERRKRTERRR